MELQANWIFRLTESGSPGAYFSAVRKVMICYVLAPVALAPFPVYGALWGWRAACMHLLLVVLILLILMERLLSGLDQIPFTSSYFPGKANIKVKFGLYWVLFVTLTFVVTHIEAWLLHRPLKLLAVALLLSGWLCREVVKRRRREAELPGLSYEQRPDWGVITLGLSR